MPGQRLFEAAPQPKRTWSAEGPNKKLGEGPAFEVFFFVLFL